MNTMYIYNVKTWCVIGLMALASNIYAQQQDLNREMTLEREYDPSVGDANKVNILPVVKEPEVRKMSIDYATQNIPAIPEKEISILPSGKIMTDILYNKRRGYLNVGFGPIYMNINGDFGYHILSTDKDQLNVFISHRSAGGEREYLQSDEEQKVKLNDNLGGLSYNHNFEKASLRLGAKYGYNAFNYFGYPLRPLPATFDRETNQVDQQIQANIGIQSREGYEAGYLLDLGYTNFSRKHGIALNNDGIKENIFHVKGGMSAAFGGNQSIGLEGLVNYLSYDIPSSLSTTQITFTDHAQITLSPYYTVEGGSWKVKLGMNAMLISKGNKKFAASPNVAADVEIANKTVLYLNAGGGLRVNSAYELSQTNRYVNPWAGAAPSRTWLDGTVGLKSGFAPGFWFDLFAGYNMTDDDVLFSPSSETIGISNYSNLLVLNTSRLLTGAELRYNYQKLFDVSLKGVYNNWDVKADDRIGGILPTEWKAYYRPKMEITSTIDVRPVDNLTISAKYYLATDRYAWSPSWANYKMKNINELSLAGMCNFNDTFGLYVQLNNLLFQKYENFYGYPVQGFNAMAGIVINF